MKPSNHAKISILLSRMREIVPGANALLTDVLLTDILTVPSGLTAASLTVEFRLGD